MSTLVLVAAGAGSVGGLVGFLARRRRGTGRPVPPPERDRDTPEEERR